MIYKSSDVMQKIDEVTQFGCEKSPLRIKGLIPCRLPIGNLQKSGF